MSDRNDPDSVCEGCGGIADLSIDSDITPITDAGKRMLGDRIRANSTKLCVECCARAGTFVESGGLNRDGSDPH